MSIKKNCSCDLDGVCPYVSEGWGSCEYWCGSEEPQDNPDLWDECSEAKEGFWIRSSEEIEPAPAPELTSENSEDEEFCDGCQFGGECENCEEYYWYT